MTVRLRGTIASRLGKLLYGAHMATLALGLALVGWPAYVYVESEFVQWSGSREIAHAAAAQAAGNMQEVIVPKSARPAPRAKKTEQGSVLAQFEIPRLKVSYVLLEGTDARTLDKSIGHIEDTALPGEDGNISIAGHRNTHFKQLEWIRRGDDILLKTKDGDYTYKVEWIRLFTPKDLYVINPEHGPAVTLITCFPFEYVGNAPRRMIVRALPTDETKAKLSPASDLKRGG